MIALPDSHGSRRAPRLPALLCAATVSLALAGAAVAQEGTRIDTRSTQRAAGSSVETVDTAPVIRPEFPVPDEPGMLFYLQRSTNSNTVIYAARFLEDGRLDPDEPIVAYWRRYNTTGEKLPLKMIEDSFAFGVRAQATPDPDVFRIYIVSYPERTATLRRTGPGEARLSLRAGAYEYEPVYAYVDVDESGMVPSVRSVSVIGRDMASGNPLVETIRIE
uniref:DUF4833 domain-containing protein n=1 Tax=Stappia sp. TaxID=1870903 RepID=UPI003BAB19BF